MSSGLTERVELQIGLDRLLALLDADRAFVSVGDRDGGVLHMNQAGRAMVGLGPDEELTGYRIAYHGRSPEWADALHAMVAREGVWRGRSALLDRDGQPLWVDQELVAHYALDGTVAYFSTIARAIDEHQRREVPGGRRATDVVEERADEQDRLAAVGKLAAGMAHDFNNVVAAISLYAELLETQQRLDHEGSSYVEAIRQQAQRGTSLVWQFLDFANRSPLARADMDLARFLDQLVRLLRRTVGDQVQLRLDHDDDPYWVQADATRLQQIFMQLVANANHAMDGAGAITIALCRPDLDADHGWPLDQTLRQPCVRFDVVDTGPGMAADVLARAFEPFFSTKAPGRGTGLGLAQVSSLVAQHGGHIDVSSTPGTGTKVSIWLPAPEAPTLGPRSVPLGLVQGRGDVVLVVDDDPAVGAATAKVVAWLGYRATAVQSAQAACAIVAEAPGSIAAILTDMMMPGMDGETLAQLVADRWPELPVILMSGYPPSAPVEAPAPPSGCRLPRRAVSRGLQKPFSSRQLAQALESALRRP